MVFPFVSLRLYCLFDFSPLPVELFFSFGKKLHSSNENIYRYGCVWVMRKIISLSRSAGNIFSFWPQGKTFREFYYHCCVLFLSIILFFSKSLLSLLLPFLSRFHRGCFPIVSRAMFVLITFDFESLTLPGGNVSINLVFSLNR